MAAESLAAKVAELPWYHTIELPGDIVTPGEYDHRSIMHRVPLPEDLTGCRCLDIGTHDGFWAFEMERRGAASVTAIDLEDPDQLDWPEPRPDIPADVLAHIAASKRSFDVARDALDSKVERRWMSLYDLQPDIVGRFDLAFLGTLLHHLRDPLGALQSVRRVVDGRLILVAVFSPFKTAVLPFTPVTELLELGNYPFFEVPNIAGLRRQLEIGGWRVERWGRPHLQTFGSGRQRLPTRWRGLPNLRTVPRQLLQRTGIPHVSVVARPR